MSRRLRGLVFVLAAAAVFGAPPVAAGPADARIHELATQPERDELFVSYRLDRAFDSQVLDRLHSGFRLRFEHQVDLVVPRGALLPNRFVAGTSIRTEVAYDDLTRQYRLFRSTRAKGKRRAPSLFEVDVTRKTESLEEAIEWMTRIDAVPLPWGGGIPQDDRVKLRVRSDLGRRWVLFLIPSRHAVSAELGLEF